MRILTLALISIALSGCALLPKNTVMLGGINDIVTVPVGGKVCNVPLPTDEPGKTYCIVTTKPMMLVSLDAQNRIEKGCK